MSEAIYKVTLPYNFLAEHRHRAGVIIPRDGGYEGPLTDQQFEAIEADEWLTLEAVSDPEAEARAEAEAKEQADEAVKAKEAAAKQAAAEKAKAEAEAKAKAADTQAN